MYSRRHSIHSTNSSYICGHIQHVFLHYHHYHWFLSCYFLGLLCTSPKYTPIIIPSLHVQENAMFFKSIDDANRLRSQVSECFERAALPMTSEEVCADNDDYGSS